VNQDGSLYVTAHRLTEPDGTDTSEGRDILLLVPGQALTVVARALAGMLHKVGLLSSGNEELVTFAVKCRETSKHWT
jgi:hypothetical protein